MRQRQISEQQRTAGSPTSVPFAFLPPSHPPRGFSPCVLPNSTPSPRRCCSRLAPSLTALLRGLGRGSRPAGNGRAALDRVLALRGCRLRAQRRNSILRAARERATLRVESPRWALRRSTPSLTHTTSPERRRRHGRGGGRALVEVVVELQAGGGPLLPVEVELAWLGSGLGLGLGLGLGFGFGLAASG